MSITGDPLFVAAELQYRRESFSAGLPSVARAPRHHPRLARLAAARPHWHHRHAARAA